MYTTRRCFWYDDDGHPRAHRDNVRRGCENRNCTFIHPSDPEWPTAPPSRPPPLHLVSSQERQQLIADALGGGSKDRDRERSPPHPTLPTLHIPLPRTSAASSSSPNPSTSMPRDPLADRGSTSYPSFSTRTPAPPPAGTLSRRDSSGSALPSKLRDRDASRDVMMRDRSPSNSTSSFDQRDRERGRREVDSYRRSDEREKERDRADDARSRTSMSTKPALVAETSTPKTPGLAGGSSGKEQTRVDKLEKWVQRIKIFADALVLRTEYVRLEREVQDFRQMNGSSRLADVSEDVRARLTKHLADLEAQWDQKKNELNRVVYRIVDSDFWPVPANAHMPDLASPEEKFKELRLTVWELSEGVRELKEMVTTVNARAQGLGTELGLEKGKGKEPVADATKKEDTADGQPPLKRRRVSDNEDVTLQQQTKTGSPMQGQSPSATAPSAAPELRVESAIDPDLLNGIQERMNSLEARLCEVENDMVTTDHFLTESLDDKIEEKLAELNLGNKDEAAPDTGQVITAQMKLLQENVDSVGQDIEALAKEVANMILKSGDADDEIVKLRKENEEMRQHITTLEEQQKMTSEELRKQRAELNALNAALSTFMAQLPNLPPAPADDLGTLLESLLPPLLVAVRQDMEPLLAKTRADVEELLKSQGEELSSTVVSKLATVLRAVETIKEWMDNIMAAAGFSGLHVVGGGGGPLQVSNGLRSVSIPPTGERIMTGKPT